MAGRVHQAKKARIRGQSRLHGLCRLSGLRGLRGLSGQVFLVHRATVTERAMEVRMHKTADKRTPAEALGRKDMLSDLMAY